MNWSNMNYRPSELWNSKGVDHRPGELWNSRNSENSENSDGERKAKEC